MSEWVAVSALLGKTLTAVTVNAEGDVLEFAANDGTAYRMYHMQDCCESVAIDDICGDLSDLVGSPIVQAEEVSSDALGFADLPRDDYEDSHTWTFYRLATAKGLVVIRWYGTSNGYYSESVDFEQTEGGSRE